MEVGTMMNPQNAEYKEQGKEAYKTKGQHLGKWFIYSNNVKKSTLNINEINQLKWSNSLTG